MDISTLQKLIQQVACLKGQGKKGGGKGDSKGSGKGSNKGGKSSGVLYGKGRKAGRTKEGEQKIRGNAD